MLDHHQRDWRSDQRIRQHHRLQVCVAHIWCWLVSSSFWAVLVRHLRTRWTQAEFLVFCVIVENAKHYLLLLILRACSSAFGFAPPAPSFTFQLLLALLLLRWPVFVALLQLLLFYFPLLCAFSLPVILFTSGFAHLDFHSIFSPVQPLLQLWCSRCLTIC